MKYKIPFILLLLFISCAEKQSNKKVEAKETSKSVKLMTLNPGHFHAALVQKIMYPQVDATIYLYAPDGPEAKDFLNKIKSYNSRSVSPTQWKIESTLTNDYLGEMLTDKPGNVMIVAGKNSKKIDYVLEAVKAGLNVYADKPLVINPEGFDKLKQAFKIAEEKGVLIYDIMTERFESTTTLQKQFSTLPNIFGELIDGTLEEPAISKESIHHFFKYVSGQPLVRPPWFFDVYEEGEGIVDVTTHLVDLVQWEVFPNQIIDTTDIEMLAAKRWPTRITKKQFEAVTGLQEYPEYLEKDVKDDMLHVYCNGEMTYKIRGKYAKVSVTWNYQAPEGTGDTHYSIMRGTKSDLIIKQGALENFKPVLYIESKGKKGFENRLKKALQNKISKQFLGISMEKITDTKWKINIPKKFKIGHEAHFGQVTQNYLDYLEQGKLPDWEIPNMITKYYTTIEAYKMAQNSK